MAEPLFRRLALIGIGLIGSSVARIARERGDLAAEVVVNARTAKTLERVRELGFADRIEADAGPRGGRAPTASCCARRWGRSPTSPRRSRRTWRRARC